MHNPTRPTRHKGFSLIELLMALAVLALVCALVVPKFLNVKNQANEVVAQQMAGELNSTYAHWQDAGGHVNATPSFSQIYTVLASPPGVNTDSGDGVTLTNADGSTTVVTPPTLQDAGLSNQARIAPIANLDTATSPTIAYASGGNFAIIFDGNKFTVIPTNDLNNLSWSFIGTGRVRDLYTSYPDADSETGAPLMLGGQPLPPGFSVPNDDEMVALSGTVYAYSNGNLYKIDYLNLEPILDTPVFKGFIWPKLKLTMSSAPLNN